MKKIIIVTISFLVTAVRTGAQAQKIQDIIGTWEVVGEKTGASLRVVDSNTIILTYGGEKKIITDYKIDFSKSPSWFDFTATGDSSVLKVKSLVQKTGDDVLKWQLFIDEERPFYFTSNKGELLYLRKTNPASSSVAATR